MKLTTILAALLMSATVAFSQGSIVFNNGVVGAVRTRVYQPLATSPTVSRHGNGTNDFPAGTTDWTGAIACAGTNFTVQLWGGPTTASDDQLTVGQGLATAGFRTGNAAGFINTPVGLNPTIEGVLAGQNARIQIRAWDNMLGTVNSWSAAMANPSIARGASPSFISDPLGGGPITSPNLVGQDLDPGPGITRGPGLESFSLAVPEPSIIALGVLGLGALLFRRRK